jgi:hypothetical protein
MEKVFNTICCVIQLAINSQFLVVLCNKIIQMAQNTPGSFVQQNFSKILQVIGALDISLECLLIVKRRGTLLVKLRLTEKKQKKILVMKILKRLKSNLTLTTTLGTPKKW